MSSETTKPKLTPSFELLSKSYERIKANWKVFLIINSIGLALTVLGFMADISSRNSDKATTTADQITSSLGTEFSVLFGVSMFVGLVAILFFAIVYSVVINALNLQLAQGKKPTLRTVWDQARPKIVDVFFANVLAGLYILGGLILFIVPGLIMIRRYYLVSYFVLDKNLAPTDALKQSAAASKPVSGYVWGLLGVTILLSLTGIIPLVGGLISTALTMAYSVAPALRYQEIKDLA